MNSVIKKLDNLSKLIGNTPLVEISLEYKGKPMKVYAKLEYYNLTGSIKDRIAIYMMKQAYMDGRLKDGDIIMEATSGNTGISFAAIGTYLNHPVHIYMPDWLSSERFKLLESYNAKLHLISKENGGFMKCIEITEKCYKNCPNIFLPKQFENVDNPDAHYYSTGPEIYYTLKKRHLIPTALVAGVGTGGTLMGIGRYLRNKNNKVKIYPLEPSNSPTLSTGNHSGHHRIQGISDEFVPAIFNKKITNEIISVHDGDAIIMAQMLSKQLGLGVGISSGANFLGAIKAIDMSTLSSPVVVTIFSDDNKKYLSTDLMNEEPVKNDFISSNVKLLDVQNL